MCKMRRDSTLAAIGRISRCMLPNLKVLAAHVRRECSACSGVSATMNIQGAFNLSTNQ